MNAIQALRDAIYYQSKLAVLKAPVTPCIDGSMPYLDVEPRELKAVYVSSRFFLKMQQCIDHTNHHRYINLNNEFVVEGCPVYEVRSGRPTHPDFELVWK